MYINETEIKVRYKETDQMGIVHHSNYLPWFEVGRTEYFESIGLSYRDIEKEGILFMLFESHVNYLAGSMYQDVITIRTWIEKMTPVRFKVMYEAFRRADNIAVARGYTIMAVTNKEFKPLNLKKGNAKVWKELSSRASEIASKL